MSGQYVFQTASDEIGHYLEKDNYCYLYLVKNILNKTKMCSLHQIEQLKNTNSSIINTLHSSDPLSIRISIALFMNQINCDFNVTDINPVTDAGKYNPRCNRNEPGLFEHVCSSNQLIDEVRAYNNITNSIVELFNFIEPEIGNLDTYGNKIRELLILSCTEVEYLLLNFLTDNGYKKERCTTIDYIKALGILKLDEYSVKLDMFPALGEFTPFREWDDTCATKSLAWYDSYNQVKHNRGENRKKASLEMLINASAAIHILLEAQYGVEIFQSPFYSNYTSIFHSLSLPAWNANEVCSPIMIGDSFSWNGQKNLVIAI